MKVVSLNIEGDKHLDRVMRFLKAEKADVVCLQEVFEKDFADLVDKLGARGKFMGTTHINVSGNPGFKRRGVFGVAVLSWLEGDFGGEYYLRRKSVSSRGLPMYQGKPNNGHRAVVWQKVGAGGTGFTIASTHFTWSRKGMATDKQRRALGRLRLVLDRLGVEVLMGDFNAPRGGEIWGGLEEGWVDNVPLETESTLDPRLHYVGGRAKLVVDGFFTRPGVIVSNVRLVDGVSDHKAVVGEIVFG